MKEQPIYSKTYLGFGTGLNSNVGLIGANIEYQLSEKLTVYSAVGLGSWGYKLSIGSKYYADYPKRWALSLGYSHATATGDKEIKFGMPANYLVGKSGTETIDVPVKLMSAGTINLSVLRFWTIGQRKVNRFNLEFGYAVATENYRYTLTNNERLAGSGIYFMDVLQPGGLIIGTGLSFAL